MLDHEARPIFSFSKVKYEFLIRGWTTDKFMTLEADQLPVVPRVGEQVSIPFFSTYLKASHFYVEKIDHSFGEDLQLVRIWLKQGCYNSFGIIERIRQRKNMRWDLWTFLSLRSTS